MIITALRNWRAAPGELWEWHATAEAKAAAERSATDSSGSSFLQENHVRGLVARARAGAEHHAYLAVTSEVDGDLDRDALTRALRRLVLRHGGLRTWFESEGVTVARGTVDPAAVEFEARSAGASTGPDHFLDYVGRRFADEAVATSWPGFALGAVSRRGSFTLYFGCDHALSDGASQALVLAEIVDLYNCETAGTPVGPATAAATGSFVDYVRTEHQLAAQYTQTDPVIAEWLEIFHRNGSVLPTFPLDLGLAPGETAPMHPIEFELLDSEATARFAAICRQAGVRFIAGVLAAVAIADYEVAGRGEYYGMTVLSTRDVGNYQLSQGWFCNFAPVAFQTSGSGTFTELLTMADQGYERARRLAQVPLQSVMTALLTSGADPKSVTASPNMLSYIDFRRFPGSGTPAYERAKLSTGEGETANASLWINRDHCGLQLGCQSPDIPHAQQQLARYHDHLRSVFTAVAQCGDYSIATHPRPQGASSQ